MLTYIAIGWVSSLAFTILLRKENTRRDSGERDEIIGDMVQTDCTNAKNGKYGSVEEARKEKGDMWSGFRYTV